MRAAEAASAGFPSNTGSAEPPDSERARWRINELHVGHRLVRAPSQNELAGVGGNGHQRGDERGRRLGAGLPGTGIIFTTKAPYLAAGRRLAKSVRSSCICCLIADNAFCASGVTSLETG